MSKQGMTKDLSRHNRIIELRARISAKLDEISSLYSDDVRITLMVRVPSKTDGSRDTLLMDDEPEKAIAAMRSLLADPNSEKYANGG